MTAPVNPRQKEEAEHSDEGADGADIWADLLHGHEQAARLPEFAPGEPARGLGKPESGPDCAEEDRQHDEIPQNHGTGMRAGLADEAGVRGLRAEKGILLCEVVGKADEAEREQCDHAGDGRGMPLRPGHGLAQIARGAREDRPAFQETPRILRDFTRGGVAARRFLFEALQADRREVARHVGVDLRRRDGLGVDDAHHRLRRCRLTERRAAREHLVEDCAERIHVCLRADAIVPRLHLLGSHVARAAHHRAGLRERAFHVHALREAEVREMRRALRVHEHVVWLQVAVQDAALMRELHGIGDGREQFRGLPGGERLATAVVGEIFSVHEIHREIMLPAVLADLVDGDDVRVPEIRRRLGLREETLHVLRRGEHAAADHLQRDGAVQARLFCAPHDAHAALRDFIEQLVVAEILEPFAGREDALHEALRAEPAGRVVGQECVAVGAGADGFHGCDLVSHVSYPWPEKGYAPLLFHPRSAANSSASSASTSSGLVTVSAISSRMRSR